MEKVVMRDLRAALILSEPVPDPATGVVHRLSVTLEGPGLRASRQVCEGYDDGFRSLAAYVAGLVAEWRGWDGSRDYESMDGDLLLRATHDGHVSLGVRLQESAEPDDWRVETTVRLDAGEALRASAADIAELVGVRLP